MKPSLPILFAIVALSLAACDQAQEPESHCYARNPVDTQSGATTPCPSEVKNGIKWSGTAEVGIRSHVPAGQIYVQK